MSRMEGLHGKKVGKNDGLPGKQVMQRIHD